MIEVEKLTKSYGAFQAVRGISFEVGKAEVVGFLGPNGAGKSTTLRILAGFLGMTSGRVKIAGHDILDDSAAARAAIGYMPEGAPLYPEMRVEEYLKFRVELKNVPRKERLTCVERAMRDTHLDDMSDVLIGNLSKGYKQRVALADALVARPPILIFDEPTAHLDPNQIRDVRTLIRELGEQHTVLLSTHILPEVEGVCSRAFVIARGKLVAQGSIDSLRATRRSTHARLVVRPADTSPELDRALIDVLSKVSTVAKVDPLDAPSRGLVALEIHWKKKVEDTSQALEEVIQIVISRGWKLREASPARATLDEVFEQLTTSDSPAETAKSEPSSKSTSAAELTCSDADRIDGATNLCVSGTMHV